MNSFIRQSYVFNYLILDFVTPFGPQSVSKHTLKYDMSMKIFDWKKREEFKKYEVPDGLYSI